MAMYSGSSAWPIDLHTEIYNSFSPDIAMHVEEAFERAGVAPEAIGQRHIESTYRSLHYMLNSEWHTLGMRQWMLKYAEWTTVTGLQTFTLPVGAIDMFDAVLLRSKNATPINRMSRSEWLEIPNKTMLGRPDRYFPERQADKVQVFLWRSPENSTDVIQYYYFRQMARPGSMLNSLDMPPHALQAFVSGLAARIAEKFAKEQFQMLWQMYCGGTLQPGKIGGVLAAAIDEDRDRADVALTVSISPRGGRRIGG